MQVYDSQGKRLHLAAEKCRACTERLWHTANRAWKASLYAAIPFADERAEFPEGH